MKKIKVPFLEVTTEHTNLEDLSGDLYNFERHVIGHTPFPAYPYKPDVQFSIAHLNHCVLLKYEVSERHIRAVNNVINSAVWEDSCVEFFIGFDESGYYNFEFNCIGTALAGFGKDRVGREFLPEETVKSIKCRTIIKRSNDQDIEWQLTVMIPVEVFVHHRISSLHGRLCRGNFYKCGDRLPEPHFLSWSDIQSPEPNFHLPEFFGSIVFE